MCPDLFKAIQKLPWRFAEWWQNGITLAKRVFDGVRRNGPSYIMLWIRENHVEVDETGRMVIEALEFFHSFVTYDRLLEYLKDHNWAGLRMDTSTQRQRDIKDLAIQKAVAKKRENIEKLKKSLMGRHPTGTDRFCVGYIAGEAQKLLGVSRGTAVGYAKIVHYGRKQGLLNSEIKQLAQVVSEKSQRVLLLRRRESLKRQIETLTKAAVTFKDPKYESMAQEKEVELANVESEINEKLALGAG